MPLLRPHIGVERDIERDIWSVTLKKNAVFTPLPPVKCANFEASLFRGFPLIFTDFRVCLPLFLSFSWISSHFHGYPLIFTDFRGFPFIFVDFLSFSWISLIFVDFLARYAQKKHCFYPLPPGQMCRFWGLVLGSSVTSSVMPFLLPLTPGQMCRFWGLTLGSSVTSSVTFGPLQCIASIQCIASTLYPIPYTLYPIPYTLYPIPYPLSPIPYPLYPIPYPLYHREKTWNP